VNYNYPARYMYHLYSSCCLLPGSLLARHSRLE
jgi:hypothetical protein